MAKSGKFTCIFRKKIWVQFPFYANTNWDFPSNKNTYFFSAKSFKTIVESKSNHALVFKADVLAILRCSESQGIKNLQGLIIYTPELTARPP